jgi:hypothetical protein
MKTESACLGGASYLRLDRVSHPGTGKDARRPLESIVFETAEPDSLGSLVSETRPLSDARPGGLVPATWLSWPSRVSDRGRPGGIVSGTRACVRIGGSLGSLVPGDTAETQLRLPRGLIPRTAKCFITRLRVSYLGQCSVVYSPFWPAWGHHILDLKRVASAPLPGGLIFRIPRDLVQESRSRNGSRRGAVSLLSGFVSEVTASSLLGGFVPGAWRYASWPAQGPCSWGRGYIPDMAGSGASVTACSGA